MKMFNLVLFILNFCWCLGYWIFKDKCKLEMSLIATLGWLTASIAQLDLVLKE